MALLGFFFLFQCMADLESLHPIRLHHPPRADLNGKIVRKGRSYFLETFIAPRNKKRIQIPKDIVEALSNLSRQEFLWTRPLERGPFAGPSMPMHFTNELSLYVSHDEKVWNVDAYFKVAPPLYYEQKQRVLEKFFYLASDGTSAEFLKEFWPTSKKSLSVKKLLSKKQKNSSYFLRVTEAEWVEVLILSCSPKFCKFTSFENVQSFLEGERREVVVFESKLDHFAFSTPEGAKEFSRPWDARTENILKVTLPSRRFVSVDNSSKAFKNLLMEVRIGNIAEVSWDGAFGCPFLLGRSFLLDGSN